MLDTYTSMTEAAGSKTRQLHIGLLIGTLSAVTQGLSYGFLFPFFTTLIAGDDRWLTYGISMLVLVIISLIFRLFETDHTFGTQMDIAYDLRIRLGDKLRSMPLEYLEARQTGDLNAILSANVQQVTTVMGGMYSIVLNAFVASLTTVLIVFFFFDWRLAVALGVILPLAFPLYQRIRQVSARENKASTGARAAVTSNLIEYAQGLDVLRSTQQVGTQSVRLKASLEDLRKKQLVANEWGIWPNISVTSIVQVGMLLAVALGVYWVLGGTLDLAILFGLIAITVRYAEPVSASISLTSMFDFMQAGLDRIHDLLTVDPLPVQQPTQQLGRFDITFEEVEFAYAPENEGEVGEEVLRKVSFHLPARSLTALVGESGGGKTTVTKLITRYADPQKGAIKIGGVDLRSVEQQDLMRHVSIVFQDVYLFDDTVRNNIRMAKPEATDAEVEAAAEAANCHEFIVRLPEGYDTAVGEIGGSLSGGERQRISIARAILKNAPIVLLDEPTSALDTESEVAVQRAIDRLVEDKTVVVIAHRLSTVVAADAIFVLENGQIVERGTHSALLDHAGRYAAMWAAQQEVRHWKVTSS
ncbi:MAG: ABC transporter ATP-binding protein [Chloroflexota bacterium]